MKMRVVKAEKRLCTCCMEEHDVKTVVIEENTEFKSKNISYDATYFYCDNAEELYADENQLQSNDIKLKDAYRQEEGLLTSTEIKAIRSLYGISQKDLCILLGWGEKTIARYEGHQVQDRAHDAILRKLKSDPEWFLSLLKKAQSNLPEETYVRAFDKATALYENSQDAYLRKAIEAKYAKIPEEPSYQGNTALSLNKVVDIIRYFAASTRVTDLYKVKLMKLLWYADAYSYKTRGQAITGLAYQALPMGAVPIGHGTIINLQGVPCEEIDMGETTAYSFSLSGDQEFKTLSNEEKTILDHVIDKVGWMKKIQIVEFMHQENAYKNTAPHKLISFEWASSLQI